MSELKFPSAVQIERLPRIIRGVLGCGAACLAAGFTYSITPLRPFPLLVAFPAVILASWFFGMWGGVSCALTEAVLVDSFLTTPQVLNSVGPGREEIRLTVFLAITILLGWTIRRLALQRSLLGIQELQKRLSMANADRQLAEERARASEALRDRDEVLQIALRANGMGLWVWDLVQDTMQWSDEVYRIVGREPGSFEPGAEAWFRFIHPDDADGVVAAFTLTRNAGTDYHQQYRVLWPEGTLRWVESQGKCQWDGDGRVLRLVGVISDITHRKQSEEAMLRAEKLAVVGRLAASVAHEINNPLAAVANLLYLISLTEKTEDAHQYSRLAIDELMRVSLITQQTLKFNRQGGKPRLVRLSELVDSVMVLFRGKLLAAQIQVEVRSVGEQSVACIPGETQQIFANLVSNAIEAMPASGRLVVRLRSSLDWRDHATAGMRVTFFDSGIGMSRITMRRIFEPFFTTKTETGTGLGMWVVGQLLERQHGHVRVLSTQHSGRSGSSFSIFLPIGTPSGDASTTAFDANESIPMAQ